MSYRAPMLIGAICILTCSLSAFDEKKAEFRVESDLVLIPVSVTDARNRAVVGLDREAFRVFDDRTEQTVVQFARDDAPLSVGIVLDVSGSMRGKFDKSREALDRFLRLANPGDEFSLVEFSDRVRLTVPFTKDADTLRDRLRAAEPHGKTALLDAIRVGIDAMKDAHNSHRALLILSDGGDNDSRYTETEIRARVRESDLWVYAIGIYDRTSPLLPEESRPEELLEKLAQDSGGRHYAIERLADLQDVAERIGLEMRNRYVLGYRPDQPRLDGKYHHVQVKLVQNQKWRVAWRQGYYGGR